MPISSSRSRWKFSFGRTSSPSSAPPSPSPSISSSSSSIPMSFICPISGSLMFDPVIVPAGHTFERACVEACVQLSFAPPHLDPSSPSFLVIPNAALRDAIADFCDRASMPRPSPLSPRSARALVQNLIASGTRLEKREEEETEAAAEAVDSASKTLNQKNPSEFSPSPSTSFSSSSASSFSSSEMITTSTASSSSSSSSSSSLDESKTPKSSSEVPEETSILTKLKSPQLSVKESGLRALRQSTRESSELRLSLCTPELLRALVPMIGSRSPSTQTNSTAVIVNLSIEPPNKVRIVRSGAVPPLVEALRSPSSAAEARDNAAGALFSLALDDENKLAIGVLGAIPPLINMFVSGNIEAGMALHHLSLAPNNLVKIAKMPGAARAVLSAAAGARGGDGERIGLTIVASLARRSEGRAALMDAGSVRSMVAMMEEGASGREEERCLAALYEMSRGGSMRFRALAKAAGAERALAGMLGAEGGGEVAKEMARRTLQAVRGDEEGGFVLMLGDEEEGDGGGEKEARSVVSDGSVSFRRRCVDGFGGGSARNSADF